MNRLHPIDPATAEGKAKTLLDSVKAGIGSVPNIFRVMAASPATLEAYLSYNRALSHGALPAKIREQIALISAETNGCDYCASAHSLLGKNAGLSQDDITKAPRGQSSWSQSRCRRPLREIIAGETWTHQQRRFQPTGAGWVF